ncbi:Na(+)/H(+) antiporter subunit D [Saezia sanguinis]|uniref:Na(+)/H(+) antiporter subunit D n=1 Tax=Saezia sanguinis TaxID=1965230 RepID=A0A433SBR2_9BURK|nr:monovalent cation/H+ antiporter subunit D [Saezia sanguinis]RUS66177.1 Na(+)/H(+) antiporter subunit D [Saezia sanguinis]
MIAWLEYSMPHLIVAPILLPMFTAAVLVAVREKHRSARSFINILACLLNVLVACALVYWVKERDASSAYGVYLPSNWDVPFGISLLVDRFSAMMLLVASIIGLSTALYAVARWDRAGVHFQTLFQVQLMGINGAFLTADLFNLFVFFEILLAASYGLVLHGSGPNRVRAGLHYIAINLVASFFFLIGVALIYNVTGTLSFAEIAQRLQVVNRAGHELLYIGFGVLAVAFLAKAAMWPLNFWLVSAYSSASAPSSAVFAILTKVGLYVILRLSSLFFSSPAVGEDQWFGSTWLTYGGMMTLVFGMVGILSTIRPSRLAAYATLVSSGTIMMAISFGQLSLTSAALYYLPGSTLAVAAFFLIAELIERSRSPEDAEQRAAEDEEDRLVFNLAELELEEKQNANLDEREEAIIGRAIPAAIAFLGVTFACCALLIAGLPPLAGFIAKFAMLNALINPSGAGSLNVIATDSVRWVALALIIVSGLFALISFSRAGIRYFWSPVNRTAPRLRIIESIPIVILLAACVLLTMRAEISLRYTYATSAALYQPADYIRAVMSTRPIPSPTNQERLTAPATPAAEVAP